MLSSRLSRGTGGKQGKAEQANGDFNFHESVGNKCRLMPTVFIITIFAARKASIFFSFYKNRPRIGFRRSRVAEGQSFRSVIKAKSNAMCSGQLGSLGI